MSTHATAVFEVKTWDEKPYQEIEGGSKLTRVGTVATHADYPNVPFTLDYSID